MAAADEHRSNTSRSRRASLAATGLWTIAIAASVAWNLHLQHRRIAELPPEPVAGRRGAPAPMDSVERADRNEILALCLAHGSLWLLGLVGIGLTWRGTNRHLLRRAQADKRIAHLNAVLRAVRTVSQLTAKVRDRNALVRAICANLVETRGFLHAWIALLDDDGRFLATSAAGDNEWPEPFRERIATGPLPDCARKAIEKANVIVVGEPKQTCRACELLPEDHRRRVMSVRLEYRGRVFGVLSASAPSEFKTDDDERGMFQEMADDIAFALNNLELTERRKEAELALKKSEERFREFIEMLPQTVFETDVSGKITLVNRNAFEVFRYTQEDLEAGIHLLDVMPPDYHEQAVRNVGLMLEGKEPETTEYVVQRKDGTRLPAIAHCTRILLDGNPAGLRGILFDMTAQKLSEERIKKSIEDLGRFNRMAVGREQRMIELKREVNEMAHKAGVPPPYDVSFAGSASSEGQNA
ncbi:MAG: PAS domain S-box protein [Phycisphaerae bacterium]|nr:PAS domain S-box protein [Phycisphaerae bacterium]